MHLCADGTHLIYSTADGHLLMLNIEFASFFLFVDAQNARGRFVLAGAGVLLHRILADHVGERAFFATELLLLRLDELHFPRRFPRVQARHAHPRQFFPGNHHQPRLRFAFRSLFLTSRQRQRDFGGVHVARIDPSVQHALSATRESLAAVRSGVHHAHSPWPAVESGLRVDSRLESIPTLWTASGNNRVYLWNLESGECCRSLQVGEQSAVELNHVSLKVERAARS